MVIKINKNIMIRELLEAKKKNLALRSNALNEEIENLSTKLNKIRKQQPNLSKNQPILSVRMVQSNEDQQPTLKMLHQTSRESSSKDNGQKCKINWNNSANIMTRDRSPSHSIPKARRFSAKKLIHDKFQKLEVSLPTSLNKTGVSFTKAHRKQLFTIQALPSPHQYNLKRYLENLEETPRSYISHLTISNHETEHIKGGSIGKFSQYESLYYPHTKKLKFNEKIITESQNQKHLYQKNKRISKKVE